MSVLVRDDTATTGEADEGRGRKRKRRKNRDQEAEQAPAEQAEPTPFVPSATSTNGAKPEVTEDGNERLASPASWSAGASTISTMMSSAGVVGGTAGVITAASIGAGAGLGGVAVRKYAPRFAERVGLKSKDRPKKERSGLLGALGGKNGLGNKKGLNLPGLGGKSGAGLPGLGGKKSGLGGGLGSSKSGKGLLGKLGGSGSGKGGKGLLGGLGGGKGGSKGGGLGGKLAGLGSKLGLGKGTGTGGGKGSGKGLLGKLFGNGSKGGLGGGKGSKGGLGGLFGGKGGSKGGGLFGGKGSGSGLLGKLFGGKSPGGGSGGGKGLLGKLGGGAKNAGKKAGKGLGAAGLGLGKGLLGAGKATGSGIGKLRDKLAGRGRDKNGSDSDGSGKNRGWLSKLTGGAKKAAGGLGALGLLGGGLWSKFRNRNGKDTDDDTSSGDSSSDGSSGNSNSDGGNTKGSFFSFFVSDEDRSKKRDGKKAAQQAKGNGGFQVPDPFETHKETVKATASNLNIGKANDLVDWVKNAPGAASAEAEAWQQQAHKIQESITVNPAFTEALNSFANASRGLAGQMAEHSAQFEVQHSEELNKIRNPRPGQSKWDISQNQD